MTKLLNCPFCGSAAYCKPDERGSGGQPVPPFWAGCKACDFAIAAGGYEDEAIARWNRRAALRAGDEKPDFTDEQKRAALSDAEMLLASHAVKARSLVGTIASLILQANHGASSPRGWNAPKEIIDRVVRAACGVVAADTYVHPILSRADAVKAGVAELHDAVGAYHAAQPAQQVKHPAAPEETRDGDDPFKP